MLTRTVFHVRLLILFASSLLLTTPTVLGECVVNPLSCVEQYYSSGTSGNCTIEYSQFYCFDGQYCDFQVTTCESSHSFSLAISCHCS
jgi:hypothetical protein